LTLPRAIALDAAGGKMYWVDNGILGNGDIRRANLDGTSPEILLRDSNGPNGIALDLSAGKMYVADNGGGQPQAPGTIVRANLDGTGKEVLLRNVRPISVALDVGARQFYWTDGDRSAILRANFDGTGQRTILSGLNGPHLLTLDVPEPTTLTLLSLTALSLLRRMKWR